jgi:hypothetical protein
MLWNIFAIGLITLDVRQIHLFISIYYKQLTKRCFPKAVAYRGLNIERENSRITALVRRS